MFKYTFIKFIYKRRINIYFLWRTKNYLDLEVLEKRFSGSWGHNFSNRNISQAKIHFKFLFYNKMTFHMLLTHFVPS